MIFSKNANFDAKFKLWPCKIRFFKKSSILALQNPDFSKNRQNLAWKSVFFEIKYLFSKIRPENPYFVEIWHQQISFSFCFWKILKMKAGFDFCWYQIFKKNTDFEASFDGFQKKPGFWAKISYLLMPDFQKKIRNLRPDFEISWCEPEITKLGEKVGVISLWNFDNFNMQTLFTFRKENSLKFFGFSKWICYQTSENCFFPGFGRFSWKRKISWNSISNWLSPRPRIYATYFAQKFTLESDNYGWIQSYPGNSFFISVQ